MFFLLFCLLGNISATSSSQYYGDQDYGPNVAIDGNTEVSWSNVAATLEELSPWIQVDLNFDYCIHSVTVFDRAFGDSTGKYIYLRL